MSYIQIFDTSGGTVYLTDPENIVKIDKLEVSGSTFSTETLVTTGTTQNVSGNKNFSGGINTTGLTIYNNFNFIGTNTARTNQDGHYLIYDQSISGYTNKYHNYIVKYVNAAMSPYTIPPQPYHLIVDTSGGTVDINLPNYNSQLLGMSVVISKISHDPNTIHIYSPSGYTFLDGRIEEHINKFNEHTQYTMVGPYGNILYKITSDNRTSRNILTVNPSVNFRSDFNTIKEAVDFFNLRNDSDVTIQLSPDEHYIDDTIIINSDYTLNIVGESYESTKIISTSALTGKHMFECDTNLDMQKLSLHGNAYGLGYSGYGYSPMEDAIIIYGDDLYCQFQDIGISGFYHGIHLSGNSEIWVFNTFVEKCYNAGIYQEFGEVGISEVDFIDNKISIFAVTGDSSTCYAQNCNFILNETGQTAIKYNGGSFSYETMFFQNNSYLTPFSANTFISGFNFTIARDSNIVVENNVNVDSYRAQAFVNFINNATTTTIGTTSVKANGTNDVPFTYGIKFNTTTNNRATYLSDVTTRTSFFASGNIQITSNNRVMVVSIVKNGNYTTGLLQETEVRITANNQPFSFSINAYDNNCKKNDYYEIWLRDTGGTTTGLLKDLQLKVETF